MGTNCCCFYKDQHFKPLENKFDDEDDIYEQNRDRDKEDLKRLELMQIPEKRNIYMAITISLPSAISMEMTKVVHNSLPEYTALLFADALERNIILPLRQFLIHVETKVFLPSIHVEQDFTRWLAQHEPEHNEIQHYDFGVLEGKIARDLILVDPFPTKPIHLDHYQLKSVLQENKYQIDIVKDSTSSSSTLAQKGLKYGISRSIRLEWNENFAKKQNIHKLSDMINQISFWIYNKIKQTIP